MGGRSSSGPTQAQLDAQKAQQEKIAKLEADAQAKEREQAEAKAAASRSRRNRGRALLADDEELSPKSTLGA